MPTKRNSESDGATRPNRLIYLVFLLSGAAALIYEISWSRQIGMVVGHTAHGVGLVLAGFFTGLAVGQLLGARLASRLTPLLGYGIAEIVVAAWAILVPTLFAGVGSVISPGEDGPSWAEDVFRGILCFAILLPATIPLGMTFPLMAEYLAYGEAETNRQVTIGYAINTLGGLVGVLAATVFLLVIFGVRASSYLAASVSLACGLAACAMSLYLRKRHAQVVPPSSKRTGLVLSPSKLSSDWIALAALSGFGTLGLEVLYTRMFALVLHNSTYTFGAVLAVFLTGLTLGAAVVAVLARYVAPRVLAIVSCSLGAVAVAASIVLFIRLTGLKYFADGETFADYLAGVVGLVAIVVLPPVMLLGMAFPAALASVDGGRDAGRLAAVNTAAGAVGALAVNFVFADSFGLWKTFGLYILIFGVVGMILLLRKNRRRLACGLGLGAVGSTIIAVSVAGFAEPKLNNGREELIRRWESAYGWIDVVRDDRDGTLKVRQNLHYRHGSTANAVREYRQGRLPLLLHPEPADVAFLGLGTGLSAAPTVTDKNVARAVIVELIPEVVAAARLLGEFNLGVVDHPKVDVHIANARHYLLRTTRRFDIIVSDLFVPWESHAGYLYTVEHYETVRQRLKPGGHFCQWLALYQVGRADFELIADSFGAVFPVTTLWWGQLDARYAMVALIGSERPLKFDGGELKARWDALGIMPGGGDPDLSSVADLPHLYVGRWPARPLSRLNTDEHPWLEFRAPISQRERTSLAGERLRDYFDNVLFHLPADGADFTQIGAGSENENVRVYRLLQRLSLFGPP